MSCSECLDRLLEADSAAIALWLERREEAPGRIPDGDARALEHLATCGKCRAAAERIVLEESRLAAALETLRPGGSTADAVRRARIESYRRQTRARRRLGWSAVAASLAGLIALETLRLDERSGPAGEMIAYGDLQASVLPEVEGGPDENVVVFETEDESVVVFWFYEGRGQ